MIKKLIPIVIIIILIAGLVAGVLAVRQRQLIEKQAAPATTLELTTSDTNPAVGDTIDVDVEITTNENLVIGSEIYLTFDSTKISVNSILPGSFWGGQQQIQTENIGDGTVSYVIFLPPSASPVGPNASGIVAKLNITALDSGSTTIGFSANTLVAAVGGDVGTNVLDSAIPLTFNIQSDVLISLTPTTVLSPTATVAPVSTATPTVTPAISAGVGGSSPTSTVTLTPTTRPTNTPTPTTASSSSSGSSSSGTTQTSNEIPLRITSIDVGDVLKDNTPTFSGTAPKGSVVNISVKSTEVKGVTTADGSGNWTWVTPEVLEDGNHTITVSGSSGSTSVAFSVNSSGTGSTSGELPDAGVSYPTIVGLFLGSIILILGFVLAL